MKKIIALLLAGAMAVSMAACGGSNTTSNATGSTASGSAASTAATSLYAGTSDPDMVTVDMRAEPPELNTVQTQDSASADILRMVMSGLIRLDKDDNPLLKKSGGTKTTTRSPIWLKSGKSALTKRPTPSTCAKMQSGATVNP